MKINDFLDHLENLCVEWVMSKQGYISSTDWDRCPIWTAYDATDQFDDCDEPDDYAEAGRALGLTTRQAVMIARAADNRPGCNQKIRARLVRLTQS